MVVDVSNYSGTITSDQAEAFAAAGIEHVIARISLESQELMAITKQQLAILRAAGLAVSGYLFPEYDVDPVVFLARALGVAGPLRTLWIDVEPPGLPPFAVIASWVERAAAVSPVPVGIYTAAWVIAQMPDWADLSSLPLWAAAYGEPPADLAVDFGGWTRAAGIQYGENRQLAGVLCDLSRFAPEALG